MIARPGRVLEPAELGWAYITFSEQIHPKFNQHSPLCLNDIWRATALERPVDAEAYIFFHLFAARPIRR